MYVKYVRRGINQRTICNSSVNKVEVLTDRLWTHYNENNQFSATCHRIQVPWIDTDTNKDVNKTRNAEITLNEFNYLLWMTDLHETKW